MGPEPSAPAAASCAVRPEGRRCLAPRTTATGVSWRWEIAGVEPMPGEKYKILYVGRKSSREQVLSHFSGAHGLASVSSGEALSTVLAGDLPTPRALRVLRPR